MNRKATRTVREHTLLVTTSALLVLSGLMAGCAAPTSVARDHVDDTHRPSASLHLAVLPLENLVAEKGSVLEEVPPSGWCAINADDPNQADMASRAACDVITYGIGSPVVAITRPATSRRP